MAIHSTRLPAGESYPDLRRANRVSYATAVRFKHRRGGKSKCQLLRAAWARLYGAGQG